MNWLYLRGALRRWTQRLWRRLPLDLPLTGALLLLAGIGLAVLFSASGGNWNQVGNQAARLALGLGFGQCALLAWRGNAAHGAARLGARARRGGLVFLEFERGHGQWVARTPNNSAMASR